MRYVQWVNDAHVWYVIWSEARAEKKVAERLLSAGFDVWLPTVTERRRWSDRWKDVTVPLFPGYVFAGTRGAGFVPLLRTPGVRKLVKDGERPATLAPDYVSRLQSVICDPALAVEPVDVAYDFVPGDEVVVQEGPLAGIRGSVVERRGARRLLVWLASVGGGLFCTLGTAAVRPV